MPFTCQRRLRALFNSMNNVQFFLYGEHPVFVLACATPQHRPPLASHNALWLGAEMIVMLMCLHPSQHPLHLRLEAVLNSEDRYSVWPTYRLQAKSVKLSHPHCRRADSVARRGTTLALLLRKALRKTAHIKPSSFPVDPCTPSFVPSASVARGDRIAQFICERIAYPELVECKSLDETERGEGGFGSTGL
ncbi:deoxyuridine triphosphatase isoform X2 [Dermacentor variabilis]|uniref:deoxyuridine triphosphatase isoform X2 n=1 Tax=Dermacentor variabilis TaxID=34621 RepID=UPI003F5B532B